MNSYQKKNANRRAFLKNIAEDTINIVRVTKKYKVNNKEIDISEQIDESIEGTILYKPDVSFDSRIKPLDQKRRGHIEVVNETTLHAAIRLAKDLNVPQDEIVVLNFASARNPGGGFDKGANAQEESIARQSSLIVSIAQESVSEMYNYNKKEKSLLYSDYMIYTPSAVIFRDDEEKYLNEPFLTNVITCPAANLKEYQGSVNMDEVHRVMLQRCRKIIQVAILNDNTSIVLGAFGCGVFKNSPADVANYFRTILIDEHYIDFFDEVVFAIINGPNAHFTTFQNIFNGEVETK